MKTFADFGIYIRPDVNTANVKTKCPKCGDKHSLSVSMLEGIWKCHKPKCEWTGTLHEKEEKSKYVKPQNHNTTALSDAAVTWFKERGISQRVLNEMKVGFGEEFMPQTARKENTIQFNFYRNGELVNTKFRDGNKNFKLVSGAELIFYNLDGIKDQNEIIIVEGEMDALAFIEAGINNVVSVPNGAGGKTPNLIYLDNCSKYFEGDKKIYLAVDQDEAGFHLREALLNRLDSDRCVQVNFKDCKDANEFLQKYGAIELADTIKNAKPFPLKGIVFASDLEEEFNDLYEHGLQAGKKISVQSIDDLVSYELGMQTTITGIPSHGKSYWLDFVLARLALLHGWKTCIFSPEHYPLKLHMARIAEKLIGKRFSGHERMNYEEKNMALKFMSEYFPFIRPEDEGFSLDKILSLAKSLILRKGIQAIVIDPWNRIEHQLDKGESETAYIGRQLDKITNFKQKYNVHVFLVAHPTKIKKMKDSMLYEVPTLYDIAGSANFFNKADAGLCVYRDFNEKKVNVYVQKMKYRHIGQEGYVEFSFNEINGRFTPTGFNEDNENWLLTKPEKIELPHPKLVDYTEPTYSPDFD